VRVSSEDLEDARMDGYRTPVVIRYGTPFVRMYVRDCRRNRAPETEAKVPEPWLERLSGTSGTAATA